MQISSVSFFLHVTAYEALVAGGDETLPSLVCAITGRSEYLASQHDVMTSVFCCWAVT